MEYALIQHETGGDLIDHVSEMLAAGWECQGGVSITYQPETDTSFSFWNYAQAMVKKAENKSTLTLSGLPISENIEDAFRRAAEDYG